MSRLIWQNVPVNTTTASIRIDDAAIINQKYQWHVFIYGTFAGSSVSIQYSPDLPEVPDESSNWFSGEFNVTEGSMFDGMFQALPRKFLIVVDDGGDDTTSITVEIR